MAFVLGTVSAHTSSTGNPITFSYTVLPGENLHVLMLKVVGATNRAGGSPTMAISGQPTITLQQANSTQKAAASPECSAELWYAVPTADLRYIPPGTYTVTIPNTGALTVFRRMAPVRCGLPKFDQANGANNTAANPSPGAITPTEDGAIAFAVVATGAQTWSPSARAGTLISDHDDGADGTGYQYTIQTVRGSLTLSWTFATSDDYGAVVASFKEVPTLVINNVERPKAEGALSVGGIG